MAKGATIVFGHRILGKEGAALAALKAQNSKGGGAIQFGPRMNSRKAAVAPPAAALVVAPVAPLAAPDAPQGLAAGAGGVVEAEKVPAASWAEVQRRASELGIKMAGMKRPALEAAIAAREAELALEQEAPAPTGGYSEDEVAAMLSENPDSWQRIVDAEVNRPEGPRPAVASFILAAMDQFTMPPAEALLAELQRIAAQEESGGVVGIAPKPAVVG